MADKANVTNPAVAEPAGTQAPATHPGEGQSPSEKELENRIRENLRAEYERKTGELKESLDEAQLRIDDLLSKVNTPERASALEAAQREKERVQRELHSFKTDEQYAASREWLREMKEKAEESASQKVYISLARQELRKVAISEDVDPMKLEDEIADIMAGRWLDKDPLERTELALEARKKMVDFAKKEEELRKREAEINAFVERTGRSATPKSLPDAIKEGDTIAQAKALGL